MVYYGMVRHGIEQLVQDEEWCSFSTTWDGDLLGSTPQADRGHVMRTIIVETASRFARTANKLWRKDDTGEPIVDFPEAATQSSLASRRINYSSPKSWRRLRRGASPSSDRCAAPIARALDCPVARRAPRG